MKNVISLIIADGFGLSGQSVGLPGYGSPELCALYNENPHTSLLAPVREGLLAGELNAAEAGYLAIGAGRTLPAELSYRLENTLGEYLSSLGLTQTRIYGSIGGTAPTYFFSGKNEELFPGETRISVTPPADEPPRDMLFDIGSEIAEAAEKTIDEGKSDIVIVCVPTCGAAYKNGDADDAAKAAEEASACIGRIVALTKQYGGIAFIASPYAAGDESLPLPFIAVGAAAGLSPGKLSDVAPTILDMMGLSRPDEMTGKSLIIRS